MSAHAAGYSAIEMIRGGKALEVRALRPEGGREITHIDYPKDRRQAFR